MAVVNVRDATVAAMIALSQNPIATRTASATTRPRTSGDETIRSRPGAFVWENDRSRFHKSQNAGRGDFRPGHGEGRGAGAGAGAGLAALVVERRRTLGLRVSSNRGGFLSGGASFFSESSQSSRSSNDSLLGPM